MKTLPNQIFKPVVAATMAIVIVCGVSVRPAQGTPYIVTLEQVGSNVVATGSGAIDLTGLTFLGNGTNPNTYMVPIAAILNTGPATASYSVYFGLSGLTSFGGGGVTVADSSTGDFVGLAGGTEIGVPIGYVSGTAVSSTATWDNATFNSLGVTPGTYEWTWGTGADQNFTLIISAPDSRSTVLLLGFTLAGLAALRRKLRC